MFVIDAVRSGHDEEGLQKSMSIPRALFFPLPNLRIAGWQITTLRISPHYGVVIPVPVFKRSHTIYAGIFVHMVTRPISQVLHRQMLLSSWWLRRFEISYVRYDVASWRY